MSPSSSSIPQSTKNQNDLQITFTQLKSHACQVANFTLQWQDLEDHFRYIHYQIESQLNSQLQHSIKIEPQHDEPLPPIQQQQQELVLGPQQTHEIVLRPQFNQNEETQQTQEIVLRSQFNQNEEIQQTQEIVLGPQFNQRVETPQTQEIVLSQNENPETETERSAALNGKELLSYVKDNLKDYEVMEEGLHNLLKIVDNPGKLVLEAIQEFYPPGPNGFVIRQSCVVLLKEFSKVRGSVESNNNVREEAMGVAMEWRGKLKLENTLEVLGFLQLLIGFGLVSEFDSEEISKLFYWTVGRKEATELIKGLGLAVNPSDIVEKLIKENRRFESLKFIYAFELVDKFPPVQLLKAHAKYVKKKALRMARKKSDPLDALVRSTKFEINALQSMISHINKYQLGSKFSPVILKNRIFHLRKQRKEKEAALKSAGLAASKSAGFSAQLQKKNNNKNTASFPKAQQKKDKNKKVQQNNNKAWQKKEREAEANPTGSNAQSAQQQNNNKAQQDKEREAEVKTVGSNAQSLQIKEREAEAKTAGSNIQSQKQNNNKAQQKKDRKAEAKLAGSNAQSQQQQNNNKARQKKEREAEVKTAGSNAQSQSQSQKQNKNKRAAAAPPKGQQQHQGNKRLRADVPNASSNHSPTTHSKQPSHQPASLLVNKVEHHSTPSPSRIDAPSKAAAYMGAASNTQPSPGRTSDPLAGAQPFFGNYNYPGSAPVAPYMNLPASPYGLASSDPVNPYISSLPSPYYHTSLYYGSQVPPSSIGYAPNASPNAPDYYHRQVPPSHMGFAQNASPRTSVYYSLSSGYPPTIYHP